MYKPTDETSRQNAPHHRDYGLVELQNKPAEPALNGNVDDAPRAHVTHDRWRKPLHEYRDENNRKHDFSWASLQNFWCVKGRYLARQNANQGTFNCVIGRPGPKGKSQQNNSWLAGRKAGQNQPAESKKVFSFKEPEQARRTFGFVKPGTVDFQEIKDRLRNVWPEFNDNEFRTGPEIIEDLLSRLTGGSP